MLTERASSGHEKAKTSAQVNPLQCVSSPAALVAQAAADQWRRYTKARQDK